MRQQTMSNMKQIAMAMYMYEDVNKHFPPAAIRDKEGKPVLSWRVAILPYLDLKLYKEFHLDEPWDSEHNKALIAKMPALYRDPHEDEASTNASYFMPTGKGMFGGSTEGIKSQEMPHPAQTIMLVDAKRDIPWTKPEDIEIDADATKPLPKLGGHMQPDDLFAAGFADGHIEGINSSKVDAGKLHAMFTVGGGEPTNREFSPQTPSATSTLSPSATKLIPHSTNHPNSKIEFRLAENSPSDGFVLVHVAGRGDDLYLRPDADLTDQDIARAVETVEYGSTSDTISIDVYFTEDGAKKIAKLSKENLGKPLAILIGGQVVSAPTIRSELQEKVRISGKFSAEEAKQIVDGLNNK